MGNAQSFHNEHAGYEKFADDDWLDFGKKNLKLPLLKASQLGGSESDDCTQWPGVVRYKATTLA